MSNKEKYSVFDISQKMVDGKPKYRGEEEKKKFTYNFKTDPRLKKGLNLGVVYVTNETIEEEPQNMTRRQQQSVNPNTTDSNDKKKKEEVDYNEAPLGRNHVEIRTSPVIVTLKPKPLTFELDIQTEEKWKMKPDFVPYWPKQEGIEKEVQVEDGDLFCFDVEVKPILNVLLSKVLEKSRMEVLEEEEIKEMKLKQRHFQNLKDLEIKEIKDREREEMERKAKNEENKKNKLEIKNTTKKFQKKLFARTLAKEYLNNLKHNTINSLIKMKFFQNQQDLQYYNNINSSIQESVTKLYNEEGVIEKKLNTQFSFYLKEFKFKTHKSSIEKEYKRRADEVIEKQLEAERQVEDRKQRRANILQKMREKELKDLQDLLYDELISQAEIVEEVYDNAALNGHYQINKKQANISGGFIGLWTFLLCQYNLKSPDNITQEKLNKILDLFLPKMPTVVILYTAEDLDTIKNYDANINVIEDYIRSPDEEIFNKVNEMLTENLLTTNPTLQSYFNSLSEFEMDNVKENYNLLMKTLFKILRVGTDNAVIEKIKLVQKDTSITSESYRAIGILKVPVIAKTIIQTKKAPKGKSVVKLVFDPTYTEKQAICPSINDKGTKLLLANYPYEKVFRNNSIECINLIQKVDDIEKFKLQMDDLTETINQKYVERLQKEYKLDLFNFDLEDVLNQTSNSNKVPI